MVDDQTDQATNQEGYEHLLPSEDRGVYIGEALPPVPKKLAERIWRWEFIEMGELLPEIWNLKPGDEANQQRLLARRKKPVIELKTWIQCFAIYVGVVSLRHPEVIADMMAYMVIVKAAEEYAGLAWVRYDEAFRSQAAAKKDAQWSKVNPSLFAQCFTGRAHNQAHCDLCLLSLHSPRTVCWGIPHLVIQQQGSSLEASLLAISNNLWGPHRMPQRKPAGLCRA